MRKKGFTLAEILITLGIVGVVASLAGPAMVNIMPDKQKAMFLKNHKELSVITKNLLDDETIYPPCLKLNGFKFEVDKVGLACTTTPLRFPYNVKDGSSNDIYSGNQKYPYLLAHNLGIDNPQNLGWTDENGISFTTSDNTRWEIDINTEDGDITSYKVDIIIDDEANACTYGSANCSKPSKYCLQVSKSGIISAEDNLSKAYLLNSTRLNNRKIDLECAKNLAGGETCN